MDIFFKYYLSTPKKISWTGIRGLFYDQDLCTLVAGLIRLPATLQKGMNCLSKRHTIKYRPSIIAFTENK